MQRITGGPRRTRQPDLRALFHVGKMLGTARLDCGLSQLDIAQADGKWAIRDVVEVEATYSPTWPEVARYLAAGRKLLGVQ